MYRELIGTLTANHNWAGLQSPCSDRELAEAEAFVGFSFPEDLKGLLRETNGDRWFLLSTEQIIDHVKTNREAFSDYLEPEEYEEKVNRFIFFAINGCGDYYCYRVLADGSTDASAIYIWEHELFETRKVADNLTDLITKYYQNEI